MSKQPDKFTIFNLLLCISNNDIKGFVSTLNEHKININYNFSEIISKLDPYKDFLYKRGWTEGNDFQKYLTKVEKILLFDLMTEYEYDQAHYTFLNIAIYFKKYNFCKYLLRHYNIELNSLDKTLKFAIRTNNLKIYLLITDFIDNKYGIIYAPSPLFEWASYDGFNIFKYLVEEKHYNPLKYDIWRYATYGNNIKIIKYLIKNDYKLTNNKLKLMLDVSADDGYEDFFEYLVRHVCKTPKEYNYALYAGFINHYPFHKPIWLIEYCMKKGADINYRFKNYDTLIIVITRNCYSRDILKVIDYLLKHNVNLKKKDRVGRTYLEFVYRKYIEYLSKENEEFHEIPNIQKIYFKLLKEGYYANIKLRAFRDIPKDLYYNWRTETWSDPYEDTNIIE